MACDGDIFDKSGPVHLLTCFDWRNTCHRRSLIASLVQGVYVLEKDCRPGSSGQYANAPPWWERFHFKLYDVLKDDSDSNSTYFGAIFELKDAHSFHGYESSPPPPRFVIAFRGTMHFQDMKQNIKCFTDTLKDDPRFRSAFKVVRDTVEMDGVGPAKVWIAGHSLGASIATLVGRNMAKKFRHQLETYLFNPPYITVLIENMIKNEKLKTGIHYVRSVAKAGIAKVINHHRQDPEEDSFTVLSAWTPNVFVNLLDPICSAYISYYQQREKMEGIGAGEIEMISAKYSTLSLVTRAVGRKLEPFHLLPTANMTENISPSTGSSLNSVLEAHGIRQWWQPHIQCQSKIYKYK